MVMQHRFGRQIHLTGPLAGNIAGVSIMHDTLWRKVINILDQAQRITPLLLDAVIAEIAQMLTDNRLFATHQTEGIF